MKKNILYFGIIIFHNSFAINIALQDKIPSGYDNIYNDELIIKKNKNEYFIIDKKDSLFQNKIVYVNNNDFIYKISESSYNKFKTSNINECLFMLNRLINSNNLLSKNVYLNDKATLYIPRKVRVKTLKYLYTKKDIDAKKYFTEFGIFFDNKINNSSVTNDSILSLTTEYKNTFKDYYPSPIGSLSCEYKNDFYFINREKSVDFADMMLIEDEIKDDESIENDKVKEIYGIKLGLNSKAFRVLKYTSYDKKEFETIPPQKDEDDYIDTYIINDEGTGIKFIEGKGSKTINFEECLNKIYYNIEKYKLVKYNIKIDETLRNIYLSTKKNFSASCFDKNNDGKYYFEKGINDFSNN